MQTLKLPLISHALVSTRDIRATHIRGAPYVHAVIPINPTLLDTRHIMPTLPALKVEDAGTQLYAPLSAASPIIPHSRSIPANGSNRSLSSASSTSSNSSARRDSAQLQIDSNGDNVNSGDGYGSRAEVNGTGYSGQSIRRTDSEETLNGNDPNVARSGTLRASQAGRGKGKGKAVVDQRGHWAYVDARTADASAAGDVGDVGAGAGVGGYGYARDGERVQGARLGDDLNAARMERERKKVWDEEQGRVEEVYGNSGQYPPTNDEEEEERRIQDVSCVSQIVRIGICQGNVHGTCCLGRHG